MTKKIDFKTARARLATLAASQAFFDFDEQDIAALEAGLGALNRAEKAEAQADAQWVGRVKAEREVDSLKSEIFRLHNDTTMDSPLYRLDVAVARAEKAEAQVAALRTILADALEFTKHGDAEGDTTEAIRSALVDTDAVVARYVDVDSARFRMWLESVTSSDSDVVTSYRIAALKATR